MKKVILSLLLLTGLVFASCYDFVNLAEDRLAPPYPSYFGAAGEYVHAADCFVKQKDATQANFYYEKAGDYYVTAAKSLIEGGDNFLKAESYRKAADAYAKAGFKTKALNNYEKARQVFNRFGYNKEGARITGLIVALNSNTSSINFTNIIGIISLISLILSLIILAYLFIQNEELKNLMSNLKPKKREKPIQQRIVKRSSTQFMSNFAPEKPKQKFKEVNINIKEKYAKKLREKYLPKK